MFGVDSSEFLLVALIALVVIGPKDLPKAMRVLGYWVGKARAVSRQFRAGFDEMVREAELAEMEKKWKEENERIMREFSGNEATPALAAPDADAAPDAAPGADAAPGNAGEMAPVMVEQPHVVPAAAGHDTDQPSLFTDPAPPADPAVDGKAPS